MDQARAASHIQGLLMERGFDIPSRPVMSSGGQEWVVFERNGREVGVDEVTGIWLRESIARRWRQVAKSHTLSGAALTIYFLANEVSSECP